MFYIYQYLFKGTEQAYVQVTEEMARIHGGIPGTVNFDEYAHVNILMGTIYITIFYIGFCLPSYGAIRGIYATV